MGNCWASRQTSVFSRQDQGVVVDMATGDCTLFQCLNYPRLKRLRAAWPAGLRGDVIESVWLGSKPEPLKSSAAEIAATLESRRIAGVRRVGKHIVLDLESARVARAPSPAKGRDRSPGIERNQTYSRQASPPDTNTDRGDLLSGSFTWG